MGPRHLTEVKEAANTRWRLNTADFDTINTEENADNVDRIHDPMLSLNIPFDGDNLPWALLINKDNKNLRIYTSNYMMFLFLGDFRCCKREDFGQINIDRPWKKGAEQYKKSDQYLWNSMLKGMVLYVRHSQKLLFDFFQIEEIPNLGWNICIKMIKKIMNCRYKK